MTITIVKTKYITIVLVLTLIALVFPVVYLGSQVHDAQEKINNNKNQIGIYQNKSIMLQEQKENLLNQIAEFQNSKDNATLTIASVGQWHGDPLTGYPYYKFINLTLKNNGVRTIGGYTFDFKVEGNTSNAGNLGIYASTNQGPLHRNESVNLKIQLVAPQNATQELRKYQLSIHLMLDKVVLDQKTVSLVS